jgi:hypothetical protein
MAPRLEGARRVSFQLTRPRHADLSRDVRVIQESWQKARRILARAKGLCSCGTRWHHLMDGMKVILSDSLEVIARCWDDDRLIINPQKFGQEPDGAETLVHELGHRVWFQCLTRAKQDAWHQSWRQHKHGSTCRGLVSGYACTDELEDFAEVFTAIVYGRVDAQNWKRWQAVCGCGTTECSPKPPPALVRAADAPRKHADRRRRSPSEEYLTAYLAKRHVAG